MHETYYKISDITRAVDLETDKYMVQTQAPAKSSGVNVPEIHCVNKGLIPHMKPEKSTKVPVACQILPTHHLRPVHHTPPTDQRLPTSAVPLLPKPGVGQSRAGNRRKAKITLSIPKPSQIPTPPIPKPAQRTAQPLPEPVTQSQGSIVPQHHVPTMP